MQMNAQCSWSMNSVNTVTHNGVVGNNLSTGLDGNDY